MLSRLKPIILNTIQNEFRNRGLIILSGITFTVLTLMFMLLDLVFSSFVDQNSFAITGNFSLVAVYSFVNWWTYLVALILGINCIRNDITGGTLPLLLSLPIKRIDYFIGRVIGSWFLSIGFFIVSFAYSVIALTVMSKEFIFSFDLIWAFAITTIQLLFSILLGAILSTYVSRIWTLLSLFILNGVIATADSFISVLEVSKWFTELSFFKVFSLVTYAIFPHISSISVVSGKLIQSESVDFTLFAPHLVHAFLSLALITYLFNLVFKGKDI